MLLRHRFLLFFLFLALLGFQLLLPPSRSQTDNHSLLLNGTSAYVDVAYNANLNITGALTVEAWVKTAGTGVQQVVERGDWWQNQMSYDLLLAEGKVRLDIMQSNGSYAAVIGNTVLSLNAWHHIAGVYDGAQMRVYVDGVLNGTAAATLAPGNNATGLRIGKSSFLYYPNYFNGRIDEVRVSNAAIYSSNFTPSAHLTVTASTKGLWKFDGQTAVDWSTSSAHGSLQGSATYSTDVPVGSNAAPAISLNDPLNNTNFAAGANVVIDAAASDTDGAIAQVEFFQGSTSLGSDTTAPYTFVWNNVAAGSYSLSARATDDAGATTATTPITITVTQSGGDRSLLFNGTSAYVDVPYNANLNLTGALTLEAWVKTGSTAVQQVIERGDWWQNQMSYQLTLVQSKVRLDIMQTAGSYTAVSGSTVMSLNTWHHIAGVYDGTQMRVYLDGVLDGTATATMTPGNNATGFRIGKSSFLYYPNYFNGRIDEVRVSNAAIYTSNFTPSAHLTATASTKGLWKFDGETAVDASASGAHGTLQGGAVYSPDVPVGSGGGQLPVAVANGPYTAQLGQAVSFSSSGSFDPDGAISSYHWNFGDGTSANTATASHTYAAAGLFTATLTVTDNAG
jgi:PKD repeat protein